MHCNSTMTLAKLLVGESSRLDKFLHKTLGLPLSSTYALIKGGKIFVNGQRTKKVQAHVKNSDVLSMPFASLTRHSRLDFLKHFPLIDLEEASMHGNVNNWKDLQRIGRKYKNGTLEVDELDDTSNGDSEQKQRMCIIDLQKYHLDHERATVLKKHNRLSSASTAQHPFQKHIIFEDEHLLIVNKPYGMLSMRADRGQESHAATSSYSVVEGARDYLAHMRGGVSPRTVQCHLVHRLDRDTTGLIVLAKSVLAARMMQHSLQSRSIHKCYWALCTSEKVEPKAGRIRMPLARRSVEYTTSRGETFNRELMVVDEQHGKPSISEYQLVDHTADVLSWLNMYPITGRTHQLRVHASLGLNAPILGDMKYGSAVHGTNQSLSSFLQSGSDQSGNHTPNMHLHARALMIPYRITRNLAHNATSHMPPVGSYHISPVSKGLEASEEKYSILHGSSILDGSMSKKAYRRHEDTALVSVQRPGEADRGSLGKQEQQRAEYLCIRAPLPEHMSHTFEELGYDEKLMEGDRLWMQEFLRGITKKVDRL